MNATLVMTRLVFPRREAVRIAQRGAIIEAMSPNRYRGPSLTLANMRAQGVRSLWVACELCHHEAVINVDGYAIPCRCPRSAPAWSVRHAGS